MADFGLRFSKLQRRQFFSKKSEQFWLKTREHRALALFHAAAANVPAYKDFLRKNKINPEKIKTFKDFQLVPPTDKKNYLRQYPLEKLVWKDSFVKRTTFTATSGSTGEPNYFPRSNFLEQGGALIHELFLRNSSYGYETPTLVIVGFGMGVWVGGLITYKAFELATQHGYPLSIITPGVNKIEIINALKKLAPHFSQTILTGYPPFLKDIVDEAPAHGINLKKLRVRLLFAAEPFTEKFRDYVTRKARIRNRYRDTLNIYGSADIGAMAFETPLSILVRTLAVRNRKLFADIFSPIQKTPTLAQYNPFAIAFETVAGEIILTGDNTIPLIRYAIGDHGGTLTFNEVSSILKRYRINMQQEARRADIQDTLRPLPFVYVYERKDFSTTLYGLQIYPEFIREALIQYPLNKFLTGKFTLLTKFDQQQDQYLEINLELKQNKKPTTPLERTTLTKIYQTLRAKSSEFRELSNYLGERTLPTLRFWPAEHPLHFKPGVKQKWVKKPEA